MRRALLVSLFVISLKPTPALAEIELAYEVDLGKHGFGSSAAFSPDGRTLAIGCSNLEGSPADVLLFSTKTRSLLASLKGHKAPVVCLAMSRNGEFLISGGEDNVCILWTMRDRQCKGVFQNHSDSVVSLSIGPDGTELASSGRDKMLTFCDVVSRKKTGAIRLEGEGPLAYSPDGKLLAVAAGGTIRILERSGRKELKTWKAHKKNILSLLFAPDGRELITCSVTGSVRLWDTRDWVSVQLSVRPFDPTCLAISPKANMLAIGTKSGEILFENISPRAREWFLDVERAPLLTSVRFLVHDTPVTDIAFAPDGETLATTAVDPVVKVWRKLPKFEKSKQ